MSESWNSCFFVKNAAMHTTPHSFGIGVRESLFRLRECGGHFCPENLQRSRYLTSDVIEGFLCKGGRRNILIFDTFSLIFVFRTSFLPFSILFQSYSSVCEFSRYLGTCQRLLRMFCRPWESIWPSPSGKALELLRKYGVDGRLLPGSAEFNRNRPPWVLDNGHRQACVLSPPLLFIFCINWIGSHSLVDEGVTVGSCRIDCLHIANDLVLLASCEQGLQHAFDRFLAACDQAGVKIRVLNLLQHWPTSVVLNQEKFLYLHKRGWENMNEGTPRSSVQRKVSLKLRQWQIAVTKINKKKTITNAIWVAVLLVAFFCELPTRHEPFVKNTSTRQWQSHEKNFAKKQSHWAHPRNDSGKTLTYNN